MLALLLPFFRFILTIASSRVGQIVIVFLVAWVWSGLRSDGYWKSVIATEKARQEAIYRAEVSRQEQAARDIAAAATARAEEDAAVAEDLRRQVEAFDKTEKTRVEIRESGGKAAHCVIDGGFVDSVRRLDESSRKGASTRRTR